MNPRPVRAIAAARGAPPERAAGVRPIPVLVMVAWAGVFLNVLAFTGIPTVIPVPPAAGQLVTQGALPVAVLLALVVNRGGVVVPNGFLVLLSALAVVSLIVSIHNEFALASTFRGLRFIAFLLLLWLLTPWFGRRDMMLLRCHRYCLGAVLGTVVAGALVAPGLAFAYGGRLSGVLWPIPPTQVAHYAAVLLGTTVVLWMCNVITSRHAMLIVVVAGAILVGTHTRTALMAGAIGLVVAAASLFLGHARVRRASAAGAALGIMGAAVFATQLTTWALRGQSTEDVSELTGRTEVWSRVFSMDRSVLGEVFGSGLSNMSFDGLPIDSSWVAAFLDQGWFGIVVAGALLLWLLLLAVTRERGPHRGVALFLIVYCLVASITESGLTAPSTYLLDLAVAASLLAPGLKGRPS